MSYDNDFIAKAGANAYLTMNRRLSDYHLKANPGSL